MKRAVALLWIVWFGSGAALAIASGTVTGPQLDAQLEEVIQRARGSKNEHLIPYLRCLQEQNRAFMALEAGRMPEAESAQCRELSEREKRRRR